MSLSALLLAATLMQDTATTTVIERFEPTPEQAETGQLLFSAGRVAAACAANLPDETRRLFEQEALALGGSSPEPRPLPDVAFLSGYGEGRPPRGRLATADCSDDLIDARLLIEGRREVVEDLIALSAPLESRRPWLAIGQAAVDAGAAPRRRARLAARPPAAPGSVQVAPQWAETPRVPFPERARAARLTGSAKIECIVTVEGGVRDCRLLAESDPGYGFGEAALAAQDSYRFRPSTIDGQPVEAYSVFTVRFQP